MSIHSAREGSLGSYLRAVTRIPMLAREEERELVTRLKQTGEEHLRRRLVESHLRLVVKIVRGYPALQRCMMDAIQEGNVGLLVAADRFDPERGVLFSTYASLWIRAYVIAFLRDRLRVVRSSTTRAGRRLFFNVGRAHAALLAENIEPTREAIAERLGVDASEVESLLARLENRDVSLSAATGDGSRRTVEDTLANDLPGPEEVVAAFEERQRAVSAIKCFREQLGDRDACIFDHRLVADEPASLRAVGEQIGVSGERVRQLERRLRDRLADHLREVA
ncbi:MAG: sigma-70 family RNA polymerase sigma factor [Myxococcota bacterium]|nr:sigma-70 family RNA polymerase sigma factor [Myxococcota bacterium]